MLRKERQTLFFSATMPGEITRLADQMLTDPVRVAVTPPASTVDRIAQRVIHTEKSGKPALLVELLKTEKTDRVLVFTRTKHGADKVFAAWRRPAFWPKRSTATSRRTSASACSPISVAASCAS